MRCITGDAELTKRADALIRSPARSDNASNSEQPLAMERLITTLGVMSQFLHKGRVSTWNSW